MLLKCNALGISVRFSEVKQVVRFLVVTIGALLNLALLSLPMMIGPVLTAEAAPGIFTMLVLATCFYAADVQTVWFTSQNFPSRNQHATVPPDSNYAACTALMMLALLLTAETEHLLTASNYGGVAWLAAVQVFGACIMMGGAVLRAAAIASLGRRFVSQLQAERGTPFHQKGVYRFVRHPSEAAILLFVAGAALLLLSLAALLLMALVITPLILLRIKREDVFLCHAYGAEYEKYAAKVAALAPGVY